MTESEGTWILFTCIFTFIAFINWMLHGGMPSISGCELDEQTCEQMRASGWTEEEIEKWMNENGGYYYEP